MNIQDRIAKLEKELAELKEELSEEKVDTSWKPRVGEICEFSDDEDRWIISRLVEAKDSLQEYPYSSTHEDFRYCRPLNDPMVIQLIPHVPGDPRPSGDANKVVVVFESGEYDTQSPYELDWGDDNEEGNIVGWLDVT